jgi:antitoxin CptB
MQAELIDERFFARHATQLSVQHAEGLLALMELADNELLDLLLGRTEPGGELLRDDTAEVLRMMRTKA